MNSTRFALNLTAANVLDSLIGAERQWRQRMAGLRTSAVVATGLERQCSRWGAMPMSDSTMRVAAQRFLPDRLNASPASSAGSPPPTTRTSLFSFC